LPFQARLIVSSTSFLSEQGKTMRKMFCWCALLLAVGAGAAHFAVACVFRHPDSAMGRCFLAMRYVVNGTLPIPPSLPGLVRFPTIHREGAAAKPETQSSQVILPGESTVVAVSAPPHRLPGEIVFAEETVESASLAPVTVATFESLTICPVNGLQPCVPVPPSADGKEDLEDACAQLMPYCEDRPPMPPAVDAEDLMPSAHRFIDFCLSLFPRLAWESNLQGFQEESENHGPNYNGDCREDPAIDQQYPGFPHLEKSPRSIPGGAPEMKDLPSGWSVPKRVPPSAPTPDFEAQTQRTGRPSAGHPKVDTTEFRPSDFGFEDRGPNPL
jgi:hypothetical protein